MNNLDKDLLDVVNSFDISTADDKTKNDLSQVNGMIGLGTRAMIAALTKALPQTRQYSYVEVGCHKGSSLVSAAYGNNKIPCFGIDEFRKDYEENDPIKPGIEVQCRQNVSGFENVVIIRCLWEVAINSIIKKRFKFPPTKIYFYDGDHSYAGTVEGLAFIRHFMTEGGIVLIDDVAGDVNYFVRQAVDDAIKINDGKLSILRKFEADENFSNGLWVLRYDAS